MCVTQRMVIPGLLLLFPLQQMDRYSNIPCDERLDPCYVLIYYYCNHLSSYSFLIVTPGKPRGRIERSFNNFPAGTHYTVQENAWMDERLMLEWIEEILAPWVAEAPEGFVPFVLLDSYRCHTTEVVRRVISDLAWSGLCTYSWWVYRIMSASRYWN
jgi:DDE superfamily endonuclease.